MVVVRVVCSVAAWTVLCVSVFFAFAFLSSAES